MHVEARHPMACDCEPSGCDKTVAAEEFGPVDFTANPLGGEPWEQFLSFLREEKGMDIESLVEYQQYCIRYANAGCIEYFLR